MNYKTQAIRVAWLAAVFSLGCAAVPQAAAGSQVEVVVARDADPLVRFAAAELARYVPRLFGASATVVDAASPNAGHVLAVGVSQTHPARGLAKAAFPALSDQGFLLRKTTLGGKPAMLVVGGSPAATLWGVYELVARWGVRYLLHGDVLPPKRRDVSLPQIDRVFEPTFRSRWFKTMGDFAMGTEGWGMADYRPLIDQLAKLKLNRIRVGSSPSQPFFDFQHKGVVRRSTPLWYGEHYPITDDMAGRRLFGQEKEFWNPDLPPPGASYAEMVAAGERHAHALIAYAKSRGIDASWVGSSLTDFSKDFRDVVPDARTVNQLGELTCAPGPAVRPDNAALSDLSGALLRTLIDRFPDVASYGMPVGTEWPSWIDSYEWAWRELDRRYGVQSIVRLEDLLARASKRLTYHEGAAKPVMEVKGQLTGLCFLLRQWNSPETLPKTRKPDARLVVYEVAEELYPLLPRLLPKNSELAVVVDYNPTRVLRKRAFFSRLPTKEIPVTMVLTLHDDSVGMVPQLTTSALHQLVGDMRKAGVSGFCTRQWMIADHDLSMAYLSRAAWDTATTPEAIFEDQVRSVCGPAALGPMLEAFRHIEAVTTAMEDHGMGLTFPTPGMTIRFWDPLPMDKPLLEDRDTYAKALAALRRVEQPTREEGKAYVGYWIGRVEFAIGYLDALTAIRKAATLQKAANDLKPKGDREALRRALAATAAEAENARTTMYKAIDRFAAVARDRADLGAIATLAEYSYRPLQRKAKELRAEADAAKR
jgi:hypothetical protein